MKLKQRNHEDIIFIHAIINHETNYGFRMSTCRRHKNMILKPLLRLQIKPYIEYKPKRQKREKIKRHENET